MAFKLRAWTDNATFVTKYYRQPALARQRGEIATAVWYAGIPQRGTGEREWRWN
jgi:hypothetical protein